MCTALTLQTKDFYFGRTLDLDRSYGEEICVLPRNYPLLFRKKERMHSHFAIIGMASIADGVPLLYDAVNEHGLAMAGLNFHENAYYAPIAEDKDNIAPFEFLPWILGQCKSVAEARPLLARISLANLAFSEALPAAPLHWMLADRDACLVVEAMRDGVHVYENPTGVMTNNPPFPQQLFRLRDYRHLRVDNGENHFGTELPLKPYCQGMGAIGLPGDVSSSSRFVRAAFLRAHSVCGPDENASVHQFFHILSSVSMCRGACLTDHGTWDYTVYTSCMNADCGIYYYTTYDCAAIHCVALHQTDLDANNFSHFPLLTEDGIRT